MGYYIETKTNFGKADIIRNENNGISIPRPKSFADIPLDKGLICIIDNGMFEAAAFCYSEQEFEAFNDPEDTRHKSWVIIPRDKAEKLSGYKK